MDALKLEFGLQGYCRTVRKIDPPLLGLPPFN
jgi:hypothetical protein